ncbi:hypothetical protein D9756_010809 [Leucocoprinus leucothites]|uniref:Uncharacterized protein n=1 Tax=Leucocoprinus leucothites TaxID=201217 RepID=A0A8H5CQJ3_9AGAR|nr:hypothetical protein D9756_010809 [Leucoagaricus leucothites]
MRLSSPSQIRAMFILFAALPAAMGATVTIYGVAPTESTILPISLGVSVSFSPLSVNPDGKTAYDDVLVITEVVRVDGPPDTQFSNAPTMSTEIISTPIPVTWSLNADDNGYEFHFTDTSFPDKPADVNEKCSFQGTTATRAVCVDIWSQSGAGRQTTGTWTGVPTPIYTLIEEQTPTQTSSANSQWNGGALFGITWICGLVSYIILQGL